MHEPVTGAMSALNRLRITEIFYSIQGEADTIGWPTVFIRLTGCPLRCRYCDTSYAFKNGSWVSFDEILTQVADFKPRYVTVTGGEPLAQKNCGRLLALLCDAGYSVSLETSGAMEIADIDPRVCIVMDIKTPGSGECKRNLLNNIQLLRLQDQAKFVLCDRVDYEWACRLLMEYNLPARCQVLFSPSHGQLEAAVLADWMLADRLSVRLQLQLHKYIWGDLPGH